MKRALSVTALAVSLWTSSAVADDKGFHYDENSVGPATYYAAISNLANAVMFSGLGEELIVSPYERDDWLRRAGYVTRPPMPDMGIVGPVYASSEPAFEKAPDFSKPETLRWKTDGVDRTLDPGAQAWTLLKITSPQFHLQFHDLPENKIAALMMVPQARVQASVLVDRLRNDDGVFAPRSPDGKFLSATPRDQAAVLWAASSLIHAGSSSRDDYWHKAYGDLTKADKYRPLADHAFAALDKLPPRRPAERAIAIEALGLYALALRDDAKRRQAIERARTHANVLKKETLSALEDIALGIYGLVEAGRLLGDKSYADAAAERFRSTLMPLWNDTAGVFLSSNGKGIYTPNTVGAVVAALNALRWYGPDDLAGEAARLYPRFFENAIIRSGLLRASPLALVSKNYRDAQPAAYFAHPLLPDSKDTGTAPVFAAMVVYEGGTWSVAETAFETSAAMFLSNMLALKSDGRADPFLPDDLLSAIR
ncbi:MAG: hypothetical protein O3A85_02015 [Proteobacteria bacterium]|nr:hypothetical protein [Pseudomonadota bacterium]